MGSWQALKFLLAVKLTTFPLFFTIQHQAKMRFNGEL